MNSPARPLLRVGQGWDLHRLIDGGPLRLGGTDVPFHRNAQGHSDADVVFHAITDAVLGAVGAGDIGMHFPDSDPRWRGADSEVFLTEAIRLARARGFAVGCIDVTILLEQPKLAPHRAGIISRIAEVLAVSEEVVSLKAKTNEGLGAIGGGDAVAALAVVGLVAGAETA